MAEIVPSTLRGLGLRDDRFSAATVVTVPFADQWVQAGPEPDQPTATVRGFMQLEATGAITVADGFDVAATKEGSAIGADEGGRYRYQRTGAASDAWIGHNAHNKAGPFEFVRWNNLDEATTLFRSPRGLRTPQHKAIVVHEVSIPPLTDELQCSVRDPVSKLWAHYVITSRLNRSSPDIVQLPARTPGASGRLLCFYIDRLLEGTAAYDTMSFRYSDDDGVTWALGGEHVDGFRVDRSVAVATRLRVVYHAGYLTALVQVSPGGLYHLVSADLGGSFDQVEIVTQNLQEPVVDGLERVVLLHRDTATGTALQWSRKGSPYTRFQDDPTFDSSIISPGAFGTLAACVDDEGFIQAFVRRSAPNRFDHRIYKLELSNPSNVVFEKQNRVPGTATNLAHPANSGGDDAVYLDINCLISQDGHVIAMGNPVASNGAADTSLVALYLGGYTSLDWAFQTFGAQTIGQSGICYFPIESPTTVTAWTLAGAPTVALTPLGLQVDTVAAAGNWSRIGSASGTPCVVYTSRRADLNGSIGSDDNAVFVQCSDGVYTHRISVRFTPTQIYAYDNVAAAQIGSTYTHPANAFREVLVIVEHVSLVPGGVATEGRCIVAARQPWAQTWEIVANVTGIGDAGGAGGANSVEWGHRTVSTARSTWAWLYSAIDDCTQATGWPAAVLPNPSNLQGRAFSFRDLYLRDRWLIRSRGSSAYRGDAWRLATRFEHGVQVASPEISPTRDTHARNDSSSKQAIIRWEPEGGTATRLLGSSLVVGLVGCNFGTAYVEANDGATDTLATLDLRQDFQGVRYTRDGNHISPDPATPHSGGRVLEIDELVGGYVVFDPGAAVGGPWVRKIKQSAGGVWRSTANRREEVLVEGSLAGIPATGICDIRQPDVVCVMHNIVKDYTWFQLRVPAQATAEGYFRLSLAWWGVLVPFGKQYSRGRGLELDSNVEIIEDEAGHRRFRQRGANRRAVTLQWTDLWRTHASHASATPDPDYIAAAAGYPGIAIASDSSIVEGAIRRAKGGAEPVWYFPSIATGAVTRRYQGRRMAMLGNIVGGSTRQAPIGDELSTESHTISTLRIEELL